MRLRGSFLVFLFFILTVISPLTQAVSSQNNKHIRLTYPAQGYPPYTIANKTGIMVDIFRHISNRLDYGFEVILLPVKRTELALDVNGADCRTKAQAWVENPSEYLWTDPILTLDDQLIRLVTHQKKTIKTIGVVRGYSYPNIAQILGHQSKLETVKVKSPYELLGLLHKNRVDAIILNQNVAKWYIARDAKMPLSAFHFGQIVNSVDFSFQCRKSKELVQFVNEFNNKLTEINATEFKQTIFEHYLKKNTINN